MLWVSISLLTQYSLDQFNYLAANMGEYIVSARKYRPATFAEVVGQGHVAGTLANALKSEKLAHSFLFCGPRGVGKTTCARILAKVINCENTEDRTNPCNECNSCVSFNESASFNIIELDAASNNSVDNIRNLIDQVRIPPQQGRYKVFIIDEVHMLSTAAFNAFLKTLEEPPPYAIFILATTEKHKILPTILSRCQIFDFKRIQVTDIAEQLKHICDLENLSAEPEALHLIGQKADGAMRDALSIFDKVVSTSTESTLTYKDVITSLNILDYDYYFRVVDAFLMEDLSKVLLIMDEIIRQGFDVDLFVQGLSSHMRDLLVCKDQRTLPLLDVSEGLKERYAQQAQYASKGMLLSGLDILNQCDIALPRSTNKRLYVEIALSKINFSQRAIDAHLGASGTAAEKKTKVVSEPIEVKRQEQPEITSSSVSQQSDPQVTIPEPEPRREVNKEESPPVETKIEEPAAPPVENTEEEVQKVEPQSAAPVKAKTPSESAGVIDLSLDGLMANIKAEADALSAAKANFGIENIQRIWDEYTQHNPSPSVRTALKQALLKVINESLLEVKVPSVMTGEIINNENALIERLRTELGTVSLVYDLKVEPSAFPDYEDTKPVQRLSAKEKYKILVEKKPELKDLVTRLELKPDNEA